MNVWPTCPISFSGNYRVEEVIEMINSKLIDIGFSISESNCDDGVVYYSFVNTVHCLKWHVTL